MYFWGVIGIMAWGTWKAVEAARERVELQREQAWSRIYLQPVLEAEQDRDLVRRYFSQLEKDKKLIGEDASHDFYNFKRFQAPTYAPFGTGK